MSERASIFRRPVACVFADRIGEALRAPWSREWRPQLPRWTVRDAEQVCRWAREAGLEFVTFAEPLPPLTTAPEPREPVEGQQAEAGPAEGTGGEAGTGSGDEDGGGGDDDSEPWHRPRPEGEGGAKNDSRGLAFTLLFALIFGVLFSQGWFYCRIAGDLHRISPIGIAALSAVMGAQIAMLRRMWNTVTGEGPGRRDAT